MFQSNFPEKEKRKEKKLKRELRDFILKQQK